ncbi:DNA replication/repair protein RecF [Planktothrix agardhii]|jgi:DNA replication and repair protein RecF|uniref:DNA replication and repair protein RecF n=2 Tax=Planktothrix agardhii TaxID=1160 RepID=A0A073CQV4_PLAA1|nr:DNA replication/repair protein RecF [Planktothrix agardhii]MCF3607687.1 DNA replication/repair protein RecF [Planktothrix agardhii 1033]BBD55349.1 DNA replication and repair protein RecF [Planktothrix agardhii NIES-204]KEI66375.1 RecF [Planktothrix agardhii NIVA-CYA 126/8]MBG0748146.1 DNA replication/repair protein RecF [Planktothrix agardhii KL2]MCB8753263.1 DNA replication/repair protein RecF [Planktothrix agardhii 1810]
MYLKLLYLRQFRNYADQKVIFEAPKTILLGNNAQGKSNLLEAVELLSTLKSHRVSRDRDLIFDTQPTAQITATLKRDLGTLDLGITLRSQGGRTVCLNGESLRRQLDFLSVLNVVHFSSLDLELVRGSPEYRRNWLDRLLVQLEPIYAYILQQYNQVLRQRNALLKQIKQNPETSEIHHKQEELELWNVQLAVAGTRVIRRRDRVLERLVPLAKIWHESISGNTELLDITYQPNVNLDLPNYSLSITPPEKIQQAFFDKIRTRAIAEKQQGISLVGPHRDDVIFSINQTPARSYGSSGQQRTLVLALKLAELQLIEEVVKEPPLLLLDDVLAELDINRQNQLLDAIQDRFQTLITTTHLGAFDAQWLKHTQILNVKAGEISPFIY